MISSKRQYIEYAAVFGVMTALFGYIMFCIRHDSDLWAHASIAQEMLTHGRLFETNFLMYFLANLLSGFTGNIWGIRIAIVLLIALAETAKYGLCREMYREFANERTSALCSLALLVVYIFPIMYFLKVFGIFENTFNMYAQYFIPNVWHNSTILCCMPFAIAVYWLTIKQFGNFTRKRNYTISVLLFISILIKPSFFFVYAVSYPLIILSKYRLSRPFFEGLLPIAIGILAMGYEYYSIYGQATDGSSVVIDFSCLLNISFWKSKLLYFIVSLLLPIVFVVFYWEDIYKDTEFWFIVLMLGTAIGIYYVCQETGPRASHGNFYWQIVPSMWFAFNYILKCVLVHAANTPPIGQPLRVRSTNVVVN